VRSVVALRTEFCDRFGIDLPISFDMGVPGNLMARADERGIAWMERLGDLDAGWAAPEASAEVLIAQGTEAVGNTTDGASAAQRSARDGRFGLDRIADADRVGLQVHGDVQAA
jgi:hypothetical protein